MVRVVKPGGIVLVNMKDHVRQDRLQPVTTWWSITLIDAGLRLVDIEEVTTPGIRFQKHATTDPEYLIVTSLGGAA